MALKYEFAPPPVQDPVVDPKRGGLLTFEWESWFHRLRDTVLKRPSCHVYFTADQDTVTATHTELLFSAEDHDNAAMHSTASNTDRITIPSDGIYCFGAHLIWVADAVGGRSLLITLNGPPPLVAASALVDSLHVATIESGNETRCWAYGTRSLSAGDILRAVAFQTSGGNLAVEGTSTNGPRSNGFWCFRVSI